MNTLKVCTSVIVVLIVFLGCEQQMPLETEPGAFSISILQGLSKQSGTNSEYESSVVSFDLGSIGRSTAFYFLLNNVGRSPITNVLVSLSDSGYALSPSGIDTLFPGENTQTLSIIKVVAYHGTPIDGSGIRSLLPPGVNEPTLTVTGTTKTNTGIDTTIYLFVNLRLVAEVMDFQIYSLFGGPYKVPNVTSSRSELEFPDGRFNNFSSIVKIDPADSIVTLKNTGNVPLNCKIYKSDDFKWNGYVVVLQDSLISTVEAGDSLLIPHKCIPGFDHTIEHFFFVDGKNAACMEGKWPMGSDGIIRFSILQQVL